MSVIMLVECHLVVYSVVSCLVVVASVVWVWFGLWPYGSGLCSCSARASSFMAVLYSVERVEPPVVGVVIWVVVEVGTLAASVW